MSLSDGTHSRNVVGATKDTVRYLDSARRTVEAQRVAPGTEAALEILKKVLPAPDYDRMESEWRNGLREIRLEDGFIITCLTPAQ